MDQEKQPIDGLAPDERKKDDCDVMAQFGDDPPFCLATAIKGEITYTIKQGQELTFTDDKGKVFRVFIP